METGRMLAEKEDEGKRARRLVGIIRIVAMAVAVTMSVFQIWTAATGPLEAMKQRSVHLSFGLILAYLLYPAGKKSPTGRPSVFDLLFVALSVIPTVHLFMDFARIQNRIEYVDPFTIMDYASSIATIAMVLEGTRRVVGSALVWVALFFIGYALAGPWMPGPLMHRGVPFRDLLDQLCMIPDGIYSVPIAVSSTYVFIFLVFGAFLLKTGVGDFIMDFAKALTGHHRGGPAKVAVISSAMMGTISGSSVANVVTTGSVTIPLMKSLGYRSHFAGAVEAVASTGGQIMPPVMGAAAFVMAELLSISYLKIIVAAAIPALLYYTALFVMVHLEAGKLNLRPSPKVQFSVVKSLAIKGTTLLFPVGILMYMLVKGYTPILAGFWAFILVIAVSFFRRSSRLGVKGFLEGLEDAARNSITIVTTCAAAGIVIGVSTITGLGTKFASSVLLLAGNNLLLVLFVVMVVSLILGMGLPTTPAYVIVAAIAVPSLVSLGLHDITAHLFAFYFACISSYTPPVAVAAYAAAGVALSSPMKTGVTASRLGINGFLVPFAFVYGAPLLMIGTSQEILVGILTAFIGTTGVAFAVEGWWIGPLGLGERILCLIGGVCMIFYGLVSDILGLSLIAGVMLWHYSHQEKLDQLKKGFLLPLRLLLSIFNHFLLLFRSKGEKA
jgi:TRAP transporter 4TM/12TM fusion protein